MQPDLRNANAPGANRGAGGASCKNQVTEFTPTRQAGQLDRAVLIATFAALPYPNSLQLEWLFKMGVPPDAMAEPWPLKSARVRFENGGGFAFDRDGQHAIILLAEDHGDTIDLVAWQPKSGGVASWRRAAFCLGDVSDCFNPGTWFAGSGLRVHADPLDWLRYDREGIVILRREFAYAYLRRVPRLQFDTIEFAERVKQWMRAPKPLTEFLIDVKDEAA
jgi:hypothetical protein